MRLEVGEHLGMRAAGGGGEALPGAPPSEQGPAHTLTLNSWPPELGEHPFPLFSAPRFAVICYGSSGKRTLRPTAKLSPQMYFVGS